MPNFKRVAENLAVNTESGIYYLSAKISSEHVRRSLRTDSLKIAKLKRDDLLRKLRAQSPTSKDSKNMTLKECIELTKDHYTQKPTYKLKPNSLKYRIETLKVIEWAFTNRAISTISKKETVDAFKKIADRYKSPDRFNGTLGTFQEMMRIAIDNNIRMDDPSGGVKRLKKKRTEIIVPTPDEFELIIADMASHSLQSSQLAEFLAYSGCRKGEATHITWDDIEEDKILVTGGPSGTKNHEARYIPIVPAMRNLLDRMERKDGKPLFSIKSPRKSLTRACQRLGIKHVRVHDLRHFFATTCIESGIDFATVGKWLGHLDGGVLAAKTYGHIRDEHSQREAAKVRF